MARVTMAGDLELADVAIVTNDGGKIRLQQTRDLNAGQGAGTGGWIGALLGFVGGPLGMVAGGALGATIGGIWAKLRDIGIDDDKMKDMGESLNDGEAALFMLITEHNCPAWPVSSSDSTARFSRRRSRLTKVTCLPKR